MTHHPLILRKLFLTCTTVFLFTPSFTFAGDVDYDSILHVISDRTKPFDVRYDAAIQYFDFFSAEQREVLENGMKAMVREAIELDDKTQAIHLYGNLAVSSWMLRWDMETAKQYLDSAMVYEQQASDLGRAKLYIVAGTYYVFVNELSTSQEYYYKSIACYEKVGGYYDERVIMLHNIAAHYAWQKDTANVRQVLGKMKLPTKQANTFKSYLFFHNVLAEYYRLLYEADKQQTHYVDSMMSCYSRIIERFENIDPPPRMLARDVSYVYHFYADCYSLAEEPDMDKIFYYTQKALETDTADMQLKLLCNLVRADGYTKLRRYDHALEWAMKALRITEQPIYIDDTFFSQLYELLSQIHAGRKDFEQALKFEKIYHEKELFINDSERSRIFKDLETQYEVEKKEENIRQLTVQNQYRERINRMYLGILILTALVCVFLILWFLGKRRADAGKLQLTKLQSYLEGLETERSRLAKELHDQVAGGLMSLEMQMKSSGVPEELTAMAQSLHSHVRYISHALIPPVFKYVSLPEIIDDYMRHQNQMEGPCFQFFVTPEEGWEHLPEQTALDLYRIIQESCNNALKHAAAKNIIISLSRKDKQIELTVADDGCGFQPSETRKRGIGIQTINERAANQKGTATIDSSPGKGTTIHVRMKS